MKKKYNIHNIINVELDLTIHCNDVLKTVDIQLKEYFSLKKNKHFTMKIIVVDNIENCIPNEKVFEVIGKGKKERIISDSNFYLDFNRKIKLVKENDLISTIFIEKGNNLILNPCIHYNLIILGYTFLHSAAISYNQDSIVFPAFGGIGKTALLSSFNDKESYKIMGDDLNILSSDASILSFSRAFILYSYHNKLFPHIFKKNSFNISKNNIKRKVFSIFYTKFGKSIARTILSMIPNSMSSLLLSNLHIPKYELIVSPSDIFKEEKIERNSTNLKAYIFLSRSDNLSELSINKISDTDLENRMFSIIMNEWRADLDMLFDMGGFNFIDMNLFTSKIKELIHNSIGNIKYKYIVNIPSFIDDEKYISFMHTEIEKVFKNV